MKLNTNIKLTQNSRVIRKSKYSTSFNHMASTVIMQIFQYTVNR